MVSEKALRKARILVLWEKYGLAAILNAILFLLKTAILVSASPGRLKISTKLTCSTWLFLTNYQVSNLVQYQASAPRFP